MLMVLMVCVEAVSVRNKRNVNGETETKEQIAQLPFLKFFFLLLFHPFYVTKNCHPFKKAKKKHESKKRK